MTDPTWAEVGITATCDNSPDKGTIKLPAGTTIPADKLLVRKKPEAGARAKAKLLDARLREDQAGRGACLEAQVLGAFGGENATIQYREPSRVELYRYQPGLIWKSFVALITGLGALIAAWSGFIATHDPKTDAFDVKTAGVVLAIAFVTALNDLYKGLRGD